MKKVYERKCVRLKCGKDFIANRKDKRYCSEKCSNSDWIEKNRLSIEEIRKLMARPSKIKTNWVVQPQNFDSFISKNQRDGLSKNGGEQ